jgi:hypothetical protein
MLISCMEMIKLGRVEYDKEAPFLALLPPQYLGHVDVQKLTGRVFEELRHHQDLARHVLFEALAETGDLAGARA